MSKVGMSSLLHDRLIFLDFLRFGLDVKIIYHNNRNNTRYFLCGKLSTIYIRTNSASKIKHVLIERERGHKKKKAGLEN